MFIGGEGGDVIVADAITCERVARIRTGPMRALCFVPAYNKLYVSTTDEYGVVVVDCSSYEVIKRLPAASLVTGLYYNPRVDRVYCAADPMKIIDCVSDSVVDSLTVNATDANCALDGVRNKLYVGATDTFRVIDCGRDSLVASIYGLRGAQAVCFQPSAGKVYVAAGESLFALNTKSDTVVYRHRYDTLSAQLACDPVHNRVYYSYRSHLIALDCDSDSILWDYDLWARAVSLAPVPEQDKLYIMLSALDVSWKYVIDAATGQTLREFKWDEGDWLCRSVAAERVYACRQAYVMTALDDRADTLVGVLPLGGPVARLVIDSTGNKLYFISKYTTHVYRVGAVDCSINRVTSYSRVFREAWSLAYDSRDDKLYCSADSSIFVFDCKVDTLFKRIPLYGLSRVLVWCQNLNRLYAVSYYQDTCPLMNVVDCSGDTIVKVLSLDQSIDWVHGEMLVTPEFDQIWHFSGSTYSVIDCLHDSIVDYPTGSSFTSASYSPADRKIYAAKYKYLYVMDVDTRLPIDSIPCPMRESSYIMSRQAYCAARAGKVYWTIERTYPQFADSVLTVDTHNDSIVASFVVPTQSKQVCDDRSGDYVYFARDNLVAVDTRTDSIVSGVHLPVHASSLLPNRKTNRFYIAGYSPDDAILVVYDSVIFAGVQANPASPTLVARLQTLLSRSAPLRSPTEAVLFDASGRRAAALKCGPNDISQLAPGIYFLRERLQATSRKPQAVRRIVVVR